MVTYGALLSVNYLLIILFIFAATTASGVSEIVPLKSSGEEEKQPSEERPAPLASYRASVARNSRGDR